MDGPVRVEILGPLRATRGAEAFGIVGRRQRLLLALLVADRSRTVPVSRLVDALWDDGDEPADPTNTVQQYVAHLRRALRPRQDDQPAPSIVTRPPGYCIELPLGTSDVVDAAGLVAQARGAASQTDHPRAATLALRALSLWRGQPFEEFADHPALRRALDRLRDLQLEAAEVVAVARTRDRDHLATVSLLEDRPGWWVERDQLAVAYVSALAHLDRQADALDAAERHRRHLAERGLTPSTRLARIVSHLAVTGRPPVAPREPTGAPPGVDRAIRDLLAVLPAHDVADDVRAVDYHLAVARALNLTAMTSDVAAWLTELQRHQDGFAASLDLALRHAPARGLDLAMALTRFWDWTGHHDELRLRLEQLLAATSGAPDPVSADAHAWLAFSWADVDRAASLAHLGRAEEAAADDPAAVGRVRAVESVTTRSTDPGRAATAGREAACLLDLHGTDEEAAYAHVVAALAALDLADLDRAEDHAARAERLYLAAGDARGAAWVEIIRSRLTSRHPSVAAQFGQDHGDHPTRRMLEGTT